MARTDAFRPVIVPAAPGLAPGALVDATIVRATRQDPVRRDRRVAPP